MTDLQESLGLRIISVYLLKVDHLFISNVPEFNLDSLSLGLTSPSPDVMASAVAAPPVALAPPSAADSPVFPSPGSPFSFGQQSYGYCG